MLDTKLKNNNKSKAIGILTSLLLLSALGLGMLATYPIILKNANVLLERTKSQDEKDKSGMEEHYKSEFLDALYRSNYSLYLDVVNKDDNTDMTPGDILLSGNMKSVQQEINSSGENNDIDDSQDEDYSNRTDFINQFNDLFNDWRSNFYNNIIGSYGLEYYVIDNKSGKSLTNTISPLNSLLDNSTESQEIKDTYSFYAVFKYGEDGTVEMPYLNGLEADKKNNYKTLELTKDLIKNDMYSSDWYQFSNQIKTPSDVTIVYAIKPNTFYYPGGINYDNRWRQEWSFSNGGFQYVYLISIIIVILLALLLPIKKSWELGKGMAGRVPLEISLIGIVLTIAAYDGLLNMTLETASGSFLDFSDYSVLPAWVENIMDYGTNFIIWMMVFLVWFIAVLSLRPLFLLGLKRFFKERTLTGRLLVWIKRNIIKLFESLADIDLTDSSNKAIFKILAVNFVILMLLCSIWLVGVAVLIPYTIILFFIMRKYLTDIKKNYGVLLNATATMAEGNLEVSVEEDLGVFNPLKEELAKVQLGFKKAVDEEMKSQKMKTELITNVSHDLKTPLTAIITYVNLLKEGGITEEERASYIDTLDKKSLRLKSLIEDLFEISKATSDNITLNLVEMDLVSLIKQVQLELADKIEQAEVEFRYNLSEEKVILTLDSEKTYRIFENLILNITKYAMPHSRAYVEILTADNEVTVILKNISATELNFNPTEISERFVRGDKSRNTEGSGLGLAIVKNFVELQGGKFQIVLDGDLFKAVIVWKR